MPQLTIIFPYRNRETIRIRRCLDSLAVQTTDDFEVIFVDYGSDQAVRDEVEPLVQSYDFCRYVYSDTRGWPWNRSHALNTGARLNNGKYLLTSDVDMIYPQTFVERVLEEAAPQKVLYCGCHWLPKDFSDWNNVESYYGRFKVSETGGKGGCCVVNRQVFEELRGFDEFYCIWGKEDQDLNHRLLRYGQSQEWLNEKTAMYHQWHWEGHWTQKINEGMPSGWWAVMTDYSNRYIRQLIRNETCWGREVSTEERQVFEWLDLNFAPQDSVKHFRESIMKERSLGLLIQKLYEMEQGQAIAVANTRRQQSSGMADRLIYYSNALLRKTGRKATVGHITNVLHDGLFVLLQTRPELYSDYYLDLDWNGGTTLIVK